MTVLALATIGVFTNSAFYYDKVAYQILCWWKTPTKA